MTHLRAEGICGRHVTWELGPATNIKRPHFGNSANSGFRRRSVLCRVLQARQNLSVTGLLRFLYLSLQISSHECDRRTNEGFDAYLKTRHVGGEEVERVGGLGYGSENLINIPVGAWPCPRYIGVWGVAGVRRQDPPLLRVPPLLPPFVPPGIEMSCCFYCQ